VLDRGSATGDVFGWMKEACYRSIASLGADRKFQIIFWDNGAAEAAFPNSGPTFANAGNLEAARRALDEVNAHGQSNAIPALSRAMRSNPDAIVLATAKGYDLDDAFAKAAPVIPAQPCARSPRGRTGASRSSQPLRSVKRPSNRSLRRLTLANPRTRWRA
jgi:hypothetical protein